MQTNFSWPLMPDTITKEQRQVLADFILSGKKLTYGDEVRQFEKEFAEWNGSRYALLLNSGSSANLCFAHICKMLFGKCYVLTNAINWSTSISSWLITSHDVQLVDTDLTNLGMDLKELEKFLQTPTKHTKILFLTNLLGFNGLSDDLIKLCKKYKCILATDNCESLGTTFHGIKVGNEGLVGTFSGYWGHHINLIESGMLVTNDEEIYKLAILSRSHGLTRELPLHLRTHHEGVDPKFTFEIPGMNLRSTNLHALLGSMQLKEIDKFIEIRNRNFFYFLDNCPWWIKTDYNREGCSNFAIPIILNDKSYRKKLIEAFNEFKVEFRPLVSGNLFRQPFIQNLTMVRRDKNAESIHDSFYIGNHQYLELDQIKEFTDALNRIN